MKNRGKSGESVIANEEKADRAAELVIANKELVFQNEEKEKRVDELVIAKTEKVKRAAELVVTNEELVFATEKAKLVEELIIANKDLKHQISVRQQAEESLKESESCLQQLNSTKDKLFSIIAHDLRSPIGNILGLSELLIDSKQISDIEESKEVIKLINTTANHTLILLDNLLAWAKSQTGQIDFKPENLHLQPIIQEIVVVYNASAAQKNIVLNYKPDDIVAYADPNMLKTVLRNLVSNAIKLIDSGGKIDINAVSDQNQTEISISDNGVGMNEETRNKLFRIDTTLTTKGTANESGSGLGLILCKEFVEKHQGKIWVESEIGKGSSFHFTIPCSTEPIEINVVSGVAGDNQIKNLEILIVEDDESSRILIAKMGEMYSKNILYAKTELKPLWLVRRTLISI